MHDVYYDGMSHFYIDGIDSYHNAVRDDDRVIPVLIIDDADGHEIYASLQEDGKRKILKRR